MTLSLSVADDRLGQFVRRMVAIADRLDKSLPFDEVMDALQRIHDGDFGSDLPAESANGFIFGSASVSRALRIRLSDAPAVPFTEEELTAAKSRGEQLIWFPSIDAIGRLITMNSLVDRFGNEAPLGGKLLYDTDWYQNEPFFTEAVARSDSSSLGSWRLVGTEAVPGTKGKNFLEQTIIAAEYVTNTIYGGNPPDSLKAILAEPRTREAELSKLMNENWIRAAEALANLKFNQLFRETPVEAMIRVIVNQKINKIRLLENEYSWTNRRSSDGRLVYFGDADSAGACVCRWFPLDSGDNVGFFLSRSATVE